MKAEGIALEVECNLTISESTACVCLKLLEMYCNSKNQRIIELDNEDGTKAMYLMDRTDES